MDHSRGHVPHPLLDELFTHGTPQTFVRGDLIVADDARPEFLSYINAGFVKVYTAKSPSEQYVHIIYGPGEIFPLSWLLEEPKSGLNFEALTDCQTFCLPLSELNQELKASNQLAYQMMLQSIEQYRLYSMRVDNLEYKYASDRLAYRLLLLAYRFGEQAESGAVTLPLPLTHQLLGNTINLSRESVSREMERLVRKGVVRYDHDHYIVVPDLMLLRSQFKHPVVVTPPSLTSEPGF